MLNSASCSLPPSSAHFFHPLSSYLVSQDSAIFGRVTFNGFNAHVWRGTTSDMKAKWTNKIIGPFLHLLLSFLCLVQLIVRGQKAAGANRCGRGNLPYLCTTAEVMSARSPLQCTFHTPTSFYDCISQLFFSSTFDWLAAWIQSNNHHCLHCSQFCACGALVGVVSGEAMNKPLIRQNIYWQKPQYMHPQRRD